MSLESKIIECASAAYGVPAKQITPNTDIRNDLSSKSMNMLAFVSGIENDLDIVIPLGQTGNLITIQDFIDKAKDSES